MSEDSDFRVRPGKAKRSKAQGRNARGLVAEVLRVAAIHSGGRRSGGASRRGGQSSFGRGRTAFARNRLFGSGRRVMVKMLPVTTRSRGGRRMAKDGGHNIDRTGSVRCNGGRGAAAEEVRGERRPAIRAGALVRPKLLFAGRQPFYAVDNMEGIAFHRVGGEDRISVISDDNYNPEQRTVLYQFALRD